MIVAETLLAVDISDKNSHRKNMREKLFAKNSMNLKSISRV